MGRDNFVPAKPGPRSPMPDILGAILNDNGKPEQVALTSIRLDGATQMRAAINDETVEEYASAMVNGWGSFPPAVVFYDGAVYWLADGFHRVRSFMQAFPAWMGLSVPCEVHAGTQRDAVLYAAAANAKHGLRRTNDDKRRAVETLLRDEEWGQWSNQEIARRCAVDPKTVGTIRARLTMEIPESTTRIGADGRTYNTSNIGKTVRVVGRVDPPDPRVYLTVEQLTEEVSSIARSHYLTDAQVRNAPADMRHNARMRGGEFWKMCTAHLQDYNVRDVDLAEAISNVAHERHTAMLEESIWQQRGRAIQAEQAAVSNPVSPAQWPPLEDVTHLLSAAAQAAGFTAWRRGEFSGGARNANGVHSMGGAGVTLDRIVAWCDEELGRANQQRVVEEARENGARVSWSTPAESTPEAPGAVLNTAAGAAPIDLDSLNIVDPVLPVYPHPVYESHPLDCYEDPEWEAAQHDTGPADEVVDWVKVAMEDKEHLDRLAWPRRMRDLWELKDWFRQTRDKKLEEFGKLTGRHTLTLAVGRELSRLMEVLEAEMDALQQAADKIAQEGGDAVRQNESQ